jgi:hypothetical protein
MIFFYIFGHGLTRWLGYGLAALILFLQFGTSLGYAAEESPPKPAPTSIQLALHAGKLTAHVVNAPLAILMEEVSRVSNSEVVWTGGDKGKLVSADFVALPLPDALSYLLPGQSFMLIYRPAGGEKVRTQIVISSGNRTGPASPLLSPPLAAASTAPALAARAEPAPPPGDLQAADSGSRVEAPTALENESVEKIMEAAQKGEDPSSRLLAVGLLSPHAAEDARVKALLAHLADHDTNPAIQQTASEILQGISEQPAPPDPNQPQ